MKKTLFAVLLVSALAVAGATGVVADTLGVVTATALNVREGADISYNKIGCLEQGVNVTIVETEGDWYKIDYEGKAAYVSALYVSDDWEEAVNACLQFSSEGEMLVEYAKEFLGIPYVYGGSSTRGFDCSGLVQYVYANFGIALPRVSYSQMKAGSPISAADLTPGDLVFFRSGGHVGIYAGDGMYIHAPQKGRNVSLEPMTRSVYAARRIL